MTAFDSLAQVPPANLELWQAELGGLRLGPGTPRDWRSRTGFEEQPELATADEQRSWGHGVWTGDDYASGRTLGWDVVISGGAAFTENVTEYLRVMAPLERGQALLPLWSHEPYRGPVRWDVKVRRSALEDDPWAYAIGRQVASAQLLAPDPIAYGPGRVVSTGFPSESGGLKFDLFTDGSTPTGWLEFGTPGSTGRNRVDNAGTAPLWVVHRVLGPTPEGGFEIVDTVTGRRIRFVGTVPAGSVLEIDTAAGTATLDGVADRSGQLTIREWTPVPAGGSTEFAFLPLSAATSAVLETAFASAWW